MYAIVCSRPVGDKINVAAVVYLRKILPQADAKKTLDMLTGQKEMKEPCDPIDAWLGEKVM